MVFKSIICRNTVDSNMQNSWSVHMKHLVPIAKYFLLFFCAKVVFYFNEKWLNFDILLVNCIGNENG